VLIAGSIRFYRDGLAQSLGQIPEVGSIGVASAVDAAIHHVHAARPNVILVESTLAGARDFAYAVHASGVGSRLVVLDVGGGPGDILEWAAAGIAGYITPQQSLEDVIETLRAVVSGQFRCSPATAARLLETIGQIATGGPLQNSSGQRPLTEREAEVLVLVGEGHSNKRIAASLGISTATVKNHVHRILVKLGVSKRGEAVVRWRRSRFRP